MKKLSEIQPDFFRVFPEAAPASTGLTRKPRKGDRLIYRGQPAGEVVRIEGNLCWFRDASGEVLPFIWQFPREGTLNNMISIAGEPK